MAKLTDDYIRWVLDMDAKGVQSELTKLSSQTNKFIDDNKRMEAEIKAAEKQMKEAEKAMAQLARSGKENSIAYNEARNTYAAAKEKVTHYKQKVIENTKAIDENNKKHNELIKTARIEDLTMAQLEKRAKDLQIQLKNTSKSASPEAYNALSEELSNVKNRMNELNQGSQSTFTILKGGFAVLAGNLMTQAIDKLKEWISLAIDWVNTGIDMAKAAEGQIKFFKEIGGSTKLMKNLKDATSGTISEINLMDKTLRAKEMGIPIENMANLMDYARRQAQKLGKDVDYMANSMVDGIGRKSTLILDNLGISASRVQAEVKKTGDFTQAVFKIVNEELQKQGDYALTAADKKAQGEAKWENAQLKVGKTMQWLGELWDGVKSRMADQIIELAGETRSLTEQFDDQLEKVADLEVNIVPLAKRYDELKSKTSLNADEQAELNKIMNTISGTIPGVITEFDKYGNILSINTGKVYDYIEAEKARLQFVNKAAIEDLRKQKEKLQREYDSQVDISQNGHYFTTAGGMFGGGVSGIDKRAETLQKAADKVQEIGKDLKGIDAELERLSGTSVEKQLESQKGMLTKRQEFTSMNKKELKAWIDDEKNAASEYHKIAQQTYDQRFGTNPDNTGSTTSKTDKELIKEKKELSDLLEKLELANNKKRSEINQDYLDGKLTTEAQYNRKLYAQEQAYLLLREKSIQSFISSSTKEDVKQDAEKQLTDTHEKLLTKQIKYQKEMQKIILDANPLEKEKQAYAERLDALGLYGESAASLLLNIAVAETEAEKQQRQLRYDSFILLEKQFQENINTITKSGEAQKKADAETAFNKSFKEQKEEMQRELNELMQTAATNPNSFDAEMAVHQQRLLMIYEEAEARKNAGLETTKQLQEQGKVETQMSGTIRKELEKRASQFQQYGNTVGQALGNVMTGQEDALKAFGDASVDIVFDILSRIIEAELIKVMASSTSAIMRATAEAMATPQSALTFGASGFATAAILTGAITAATLAAKTALKGMLGKKSTSSTSSSSESGSSSGNITVKQKGFADGGWHGGYTGNGQKYDVAGFFPDGQPYHAGEYIIPQELVKTPAIADFIRRIDSMRTKKTVNSLPDGFADGGYHNYSQNLSSLGGVDPALIQQLTTAIDSFNKKELTTYIGMTSFQAQLDEMNKENNRFKKK